MQAYAEWIEVARRGNGFNTKKFDYKIILYVLFP